MLLPMSYTIDAKHTVGYAGIILANWDAKSGRDVWTVPVGMT
jgi:hypothetical protein